MYNAIITPFEEDGTFKIKLDTEIDDLTIYYTFNNTDPDCYGNKYESPLSIPKNATRLRVITYKDEKPVGKVITLRIDEMKTK
jgi:hexosaminidase